ncbi:nucleotide disphospho-sugar-binding domain-containing protein [Streptomyces sp. NPDC057545]|uniref:nucleotide disphospho-sugar-binding domain-containing protein n=1 Tax=Streptomyces sp. NPDC057545 TaxID=3346164 RepID=UPI00368459D2
MPHLTTAAPVVDDALLAAAHPAPWTARLHPVPPRDLLVQLRAPTRLLNRRAGRGGLDRGRLVEARARLPRSDLGLLARPETAGLGRCLNQLLHPRRAPAALGLDGLPEAALWVDICPPTLRAAPSPGPRQSMRFVPYNEQRALQPWMYRGGDRPRVCVTAGSRVSHEAELAYLQELVDSIAGLDVELVVAAPEAVAKDLKADPEQVRAGWIPLDVLLTTCRLIVHHGGGQTSLTALNAGVPQLLIPNIPKMLPPCERISARGAAITLPEDRQSPTGCAPPPRRSWATRPTWPQPARSARRSPNSPFPPRWWRGWRRSSMASRATEPFPPAACGGDIREGAV